MLLRTAVRTGFSVRPAGCAVQETRCFGTHFLRSQFSGCYLLHLSRVQISFEDEMALRDRPETTEVQGFAEAIAIVGINQLSVQGFGWQLVVIHVARHKQQHLDVETPAPLSK